MKITIKAMFKVVSICTLFILLACFHGESQSSNQFIITSYSYYPPSKDKLSWQRLNVWLSSNFLFVAKEAQVDFDSCILAASRSLGISRFAILAEGFESPELLQQSKWVDHSEPSAATPLLSKSTGREHLQLLLLLGAYYAFQPHAYGRYKDSAEYFLKQAILVSKRLKDEKLGRIALCLLGKMYVQVNDSKGDSIYNTLIIGCSQAGDKEMEARAFAYRGIYMLPNQKTLQGKIADLQKAAALYESSGNTEGQIMVLNGLGYLYTAIGQLQAAHDIFLQSLSLAENIRYPYIHYCTEALAMALTFQGKFGEPLRYARQTINVSEACRDSIGWSYFYARLAKLLDPEGRKTKEWYDISHKAIQRFTANGDPGVYGLLSTVAGNMANEGRAQEALQLVLAVSKQVRPPQTLSDQSFYHNAFAICYLNLGQLGLTEMHIKKMDTVETKAEAIRGPLRRFSVNNLFAALFFKRGQYLQAKEYFEKQFHPSAHIDRNLVNDLYAYHWLIAIDSALGDKTSGLYHYRKYTALLDSNFRASKIRQAEELQVLYETQEKENQIAALNEQAVLEKANLKQARLVKNLTIAGIAAVIIIAGLLYRQSRLRKKNNAVITNKNEQLEQLLNDKEWLLREIHHRVKNNLQIIMSLLNSQSVYINNDAALTAIHDSQRRVQAISLIHQKLYQSENVSTIAMPQYINELIHYLEDSFNIGNRIVFKQEIEAVELPASQAIPLGLIINEGVVNALKYAFPNSGKGVVHISLQHDGDDHLLLKLGDNGIGLPAGFDILGRNSLGFNLMQGLAKQLNGNFSMETNDGLEIIIRFSILEEQFSEKVLADAE